MTRPAIPTEVAAWISDVVLTRVYRNATSGPELCACQYGICGHCKAGGHADCQMVTWGGAPPAHGDTYVTNARGQVASAQGVRSVEVWRSGRPCRWLCSCGCTPIGAALPPTGPTPPIQLDLFAHHPLTEETPR